MAKFRRNHHGGQSAGTSLFRIVLLMLVLGGMLWLIWWGAAGLIPGLPTGGDARRTYAGPEDWYYPELRNGVLVEHRHYALSYREDVEQAEWVAYILDREQVVAPRVRRKDWYEEDPAVPTGSATWADYRNSGFDRGHLVPAADRAFSREAMDETFLMSNISPQRHPFNAGIWRELEEQTRDWAVKDRRLYVVSGPLFGDRPERIGANRVAVPEAFFKVLLDLGEPEAKGIGFILPNQVSYAPLQDYAVSIDSVEARSGIDFFPDLMTGELEQELESRAEPGSWPLDALKFERRVNKWNKDLN